MTTDLAVRNGHTSAALAIRPGQEMFNDKQRAALAVLGIRDASNADLAVFMHYCQRTQLDPFSRQIYFIKRREKVDGQWVDKWTIQVGIDGFRVIRDRIERRENVIVEYEDTIWYDADGRPHEVWLWDDEPPTACKVVVLKDGHRYPAVLRTAAYMARTKEGEPAKQWKTQPDHMIEKCAEAFALRRAFPNDLGGIYLEDELPQPAPPPAAQRVTAAVITGRPAELETSGRAPSGQPAGQEPAAGPEPSGGPVDPPAQRATKAQTGELEGLLAKFPWREPGDKAVFLQWRCGAPYRASKGQVIAVTRYLTERLEAAEGDVEEALSAIWGEYQNSQGQDASGEPEPGSDG